MERLFTDRVDISRRIPLYRAEVSSLRHGEGLIGKESPTHSELRVGQAVGVGLGGEGRCRTVRAEGRENLQGRTTWNLNRAVHRGGYPGGHSAFSDPRYKSSLREATGDRPKAQSHSIQGGSCRWSMLRKLQRLRRWKMEDRAEGSASCL